MVGDYVKNLAEAMCLEHSDEIVIFLLRTNFWIQRIIGNDIIAVSTARSGLEIG